MCLLTSRTFWQVAKRPSACHRTLGSYCSVSTPRPCRSPASWAPAPESPVLASLRRCPPQFPLQDPSLTSTLSTHRFLQPGLQGPRVRRQVSHRDDVDHVDFLMCLYVRRRLVALFSDMLKEEFM